MTTEDAQSRVSGERSEQGTVSIDHLLAPSDGIFALAVTLLVLDLHQPMEAHGLLRAVAREWPAFVSYMLSFLAVGIIWAQHHTMFRFVRRTDHVFILLNLLFLMWVAVVAYPTGILARYLENPTERQGAVLIYTGVFALGGLLANVWWLYASRGRRLLSETIDAAKVRTLTVNYVVGSTFYVLAFLLTLLNPPAGVVLIVALNLFYAFSPLLAHLLKRRNRAASH